MASSPSSGSAVTVPTASTKKMRVRSKSTSAVEDVKEEAPTKNEKQVVDDVKTTFKNGINGIQNGAESLFVKGPKDKHHDRKSRSGRRGLPKKGKLQSRSFPLRKVFNITLILNYAVFWKYSIVVLLRYISDLHTSFCFLSKHVLSS